MNTPISVKQVTRGHNIVADGWAGASNPHSQSTPPTSILTHTYTKSIVNARFLTFFFMQPNRLTDVQSLFSVSATM